MRPGLPDDRERALAQNFMVEMSGKGLGAAFTPPLGVGSRKGPASWNFYELTFWGRGWGGVIYREKKKVVALSE